MGKGRTTVDVVVARFGRAAGLDEGDLGDLRVVLELYRDVLEHDPVTWHEGDLEVLLLEVLPAKLSAEPDLVTGVPGLLERYLEWLDGTRALRGERLDVLLEELDEVARQFGPAMSDTSRFGPAKRFVMGSGLRPEDLQDPERVQRAVDTYNAHLDDDPGAAPIVLPPVTLADERELRAAAAGAALVQRTGALLSHVGPGRQLTETGALRLVDARALAAVCGDERRLEQPYAWETSVRRMSDLRGVEETFELAVDAGLLYVDGRRVRVDRGHLGVGDPLERVASLGRAALAVGVFVGEGPVGLEGLTDAVSSALPGVLAALYAMDEPAPLDELAQDIAGALGVTGQLPSVVRSYLGRAFARLARLGLVEELGLHEPVDQPWRDPGDPVATSVALTPLGTWWLQGLLQEMGVRAPLAGELASGSARELCLGLSEGYSPDDVEAEVAAWRAARGQARAAYDLAALLGDEELICRQFAAATLDDSPEVVEAVRQLLDTDRARPYAVAWLTMHDQEVPDGCRRPEDLLLLFVETGATLIRAEAQDELVEQLGGFGETAQQVDVVRQLWRVDSPYTEPVLTAIADGAPKAVSKAARKALHSLRSR